MVAQLQRLQHAEASRRELLANVSHDLRTPLASMQGYLEMLLLKQGTLPPDEQRSYLEIASRHSERLGKLINELFQLTKLEAHEIQPQREPFSVAELVQDVVQKFQLAADKRGLRLDSRLAGQQVQIDADIALIETVLENLIENALRHTPRGGEVRVEVEPQGARVAVRVVDTGRGIASEDLPNLFERYYHVDRGEMGDAAGTGLGLAIVRHIVELHGGAIRVESELGQGTHVQLRPARDRPRKARRPEVQASADGGLPSFWRSNVRSSSAAARTEKILNNARWGRSWRMALPSMHAKWPMIFPARVEHRHADVAVAIEFLLEGPQVAHAGRAIDDLAALDHRAARGARQVVLEILRELAVRIIGERVGAHRRVADAEADEVVAGCRIDERLRIRD